MAYHTTVHTAAEHGACDSTFHAGRAAVTRFLSGLGLALKVGAEADARLDIVRRLQEMSDRELEEVGVERADIVRYVFRDLYQI